MKIFISGKVTGDPAYANRFYTAAFALKQKYPDSIIYNPAIIPTTWPKADCIAVCMSMLNCCDIIYMLENWKNSEGATIEHEYAKYTGKKIWYQGQVHEN